MGNIFRAALPPMKTMETGTRDSAKRACAVVIKRCIMDQRGRSCLTAGYIISPDSLWKSEISPSDLTSFFLKHLGHIPDTTNSHSARSSSCIFLQPKVLGAMIGLRALSFTSPLSSEAAPEGLVERDCPDDCDNRYPLAPKLEQPCGGSCDTTYSSGSETSSCNLGAIVSQPKQFGT